MKRVILLVVLTLALSSCTIRFDSNTTVRDDGSGTLAFEVSFDEEFRQFMAENGGSEVDFTGDLQDVPPGWSATEFSREGFEGVRIAAEFADLAELDQRLVELSASTGDAQATPVFMERSGITRNGDGFEFELTLEGLEEGFADASGGAGGDDLGFEGLDPASLFGDVFEIRYVLTLPGEITAHNADSINGSTLTWNIGLGDDGRVLEATSGGAGGSLPTVVIAGLGVLAAAIVAFVVLQARRRRSAYQTGWGEPTAGVPAGIVTGDPFATPAEDELPHAR